MASRILIVEDNAEIREILQITLEFNAYEVVAAANGREALEAVETRGPFDLILCDLDMPVMNGMEFMRRYRAERGAATPILSLTAEIGPVIDEALASGANGTIHKPFEPIPLLEEIRSRLGQASA